MGALTHTTTKNRFLRIKNMSEFTQTATQGTPKLGAPKNVEMGEIKSQRQRWHVTNVPSEYNLPPHQLDSASLSSKYFCFVFHFAWFLQ
mmetsp:Transcript_24608/g.33722  ORF Transcript_24608/g.33722 Transcript_24608/m.33722 type:complete len:89 (-) Transcript_24608:607-873(-)